MIEIIDATIGFTKLPLLKNIFLKINKGEILLLEGANGTGKTTLARSLLSVIPPLEGKIYNSFHRSSYVPQKSILDEQYPLTIKNLVYGGLQKRSIFSVKKNIKEQVFWALQQTNIESISSLPIREASGGQLQRALISRAMVSNPDFILLDEPFANLDKSSKKIISKLLVNLCNEKKISIFVIDHANLLPKNTRRLNIERGKLIEI